MTKAYEVFSCHTIRPQLNSIIFAFIYIRFLSYGFETGICRVWRWQRWPDSPGRGSPVGPASTLSLWQNACPMNKCSGTKLPSGGKCQQTTIQKVCSLDAAQNFELGTCSCVQCMMSKKYRLFKSWPHTCGLSIHSDKCLQWKNEDHKSLIDEAGNREIMGRDPAQQWKMKF